MAMFIVFVHEYIFFFICEKIHDICLQLTDYIYDDTTAQAKFSKPLEWIDPCPWQPFWGFQPCMIGQKTNKL